MAAMDDGTGDGGEAMGVGLAVGIAAFLIVRRVQFGQAQTTTDAGGDRRTAGRWVIIRPCIWQNEPSPDPAGRPEALRAGAAADDRTGRVKRRRADARRVAENRLWTEVKP